MRNYIICKNCKKDFTVKTTAPSRHELEDEMGRYFYNKCSHCHIENEYHVNEVLAEEGGLSTGKYVAFALALLLLSTIYFLRMGLIWTATLAIPLFIYFKMREMSQKSIFLFNQSNISRTRPT